MVATYCGKKITRLVVRTYLTSYMKYKPGCNVSTNHCNKITVIDVPFCHHAVIKFLVRDSSLAAHMVDKLCSVYGGVCFGLPILCGTGWIPSSCQHWYHWSAEQTYTKNVKDGMQ